MTIQLMAATVVYNCHSNVKTFMFLELKKKKVFDVFFSWISLWYVFKKLPLRGSWTIGAETLFGGWNCRKKKNSDNVCIGCGLPQIT